MFRVFEENGLWYVQNCNTEEVVYCAATEDEAMEVSYKMGVEAGSIKMNAAGREYKNEKGYRVKETINYRRTYFLDTKYNMIVFVESLDDPEMDKIKIVTLGNKTQKEDVKTIYRYEDPDFINGVINAFMK